LLVEEGKPTSSNKYNKEREGAAKSKREREGSRVHINSKAWCSTLARNEKDLKISEHKKDKTPKAMGRISNITESEKAKMDSAPGPLAS